MIRIGLLGVLLLLAAPVWGQDVSVSLNRYTAQVGEAVVLTIEARGAQSYPEIRGPGFSDQLDVSPAQTSSRTSIVNGQMTSSRSRSYTLVARSEGTFTIGPLDVSVDGAVVITQALKLLVSAGAPPPAPPPVSDREAGETVGDETLFARAVVDNPTPYLYQQVTLRVRLYSLVPLLDNPGYTEPTTQGFWRESLTAPQPATEVIDGKRYTVLEVVMALFPTTPGELTVGEAVLECVVQSGQRQRDPFRFLRDRGRRVVLRTKPVTVNVRRLPPGAPPGFQGAVGEYRLGVAVDTHEASQGEPITLTVSISGTGHLRTLPEIELPALEHFRAYPSDAAQQVTRGGDRIGGRVTRQFVLVPLTAGDHTLPALELVTFSPDKGRYETLRTRPLSVRAAPGAGLAPGGRGDIELLGRDIRFIETDLPSFQPIGSAWSRARQWLLLLPVPALAYGGFFLWVRRQRRLGADHARVRRQRAAKAARSLLKAARKRDVTEQATGAGQALRNYLADRYDLPRAGVTSEAILPCLEGEGLESTSVVDLLDACDAARYAPGAIGARRDWIREVDRTIADLEKTR